MNVEGRGREPEYACEYYFGERDASVHLSILATWTTWLEYALWRARTAGSDIIHSLFIAHCSLLIWLLQPSAMQHPEDSLTTPLTSTSQFIQAGPSSTAVVAAAAAKARTAHHDIPHFRR